MAEILASALNIDMSGPKTYENLFKKQKEIGDEITKVEMGVADLTASRDLSAAKARQETISKAQWILFNCCVWLSRSSQTD